MAVAAKIENMNSGRKETERTFPDPDAILMTEVAGGSEHALRYR